MFIKANVGTTHTQNGKYRRGFSLKAVAFQQMTQEQRTFWYNKIIYS